MTLVVIEAVPVRGGREPSIIYLIHGEKTSQGRVSYLFEVHNLSS